MENGRIVMTGTGEELANDKAVRHAYMGLSGCHPQHHGPRDGI